MCSRQTGRCTHIASRCSLRLSLLSSPHPVGGTETSLQDSHPLSGGHPSIRACLRGRQRAGESGAGVLDTPPTKVAPRWPHAPQTSRGTREPRTSPWESPGQGGGGRPTNPGGGPGSCVPVGTLKGLVCWSLHAKGTRGARRRAGGLPAGLVWGPPGHRARSPQAGCLLPGARVTPGQGWDGGNRSGDTPRP